MLIHQTWKDSNVPEHWKPGSNAWQALHPRWTYLLWTDADIEAYIRSSWPNDWAVFEALSWPIQRVDLWRYYVLRDFGGVYADLDIKPVRAIDGPSTLGPGHVFLVPSANASGVYTNAFMISDNSAVAKAFWTSVIESVKDYTRSRTLSVVSAISRHMEIMTSTGPLALTHAANVGTWPVTVLPKTLWNPFDLSVADDSVLQDQEAHPDALVRILPGSSWHAADSSIVSYVHSHRKVLGVLLILVIAYYVLRSEQMAVRIETLRRSLRLRNPFSRATRL